MGVSYYVLDNIDCLGAEGELQLEEVFEPKAFVVTAVTLFLLLLLGTCVFERRAKKVYTTLAAFSGLAFAGNCGGARVMLMRLE